MQTQIIRDSVLRMRPGSLLAETDIRGEPNEQIHQLLEGCPASQARRCLSQQRDEGFSP